MSGRALNLVAGRVQSRIDSYREQTSRPKPRVLYVLSTRSGGTPQSNQDLMIALEDRVEALVLWCKSNRMELSRFERGTYAKLKSYRLLEPLRAIPHRNSEYDRVVADWLVRYNVELVHIRHVAWHSLGLVDMAKALRLPVVFSFHDFYTVCPSVNLLDEANRYCAGQCTLTEGECFQPLWPDEGFPLLKHAAIHDWQRMFGSSLQMCDLFVTTSQSSAAIIKKIYPFLDERHFAVIPHGRDFARMEQFCADLNPDEPIRLLVPGNLSPAKGLHVVISLGKLAAEQAIELHVMGNMPEATKCVGFAITNHGPYKREQFADLVEKIKPQLGGIFSICPETYCHTLTELWACGIPVLGFDLGAVGERIKATSGGWLAADLTAEAVLELINRLRAEPKLHEAARDRIAEWQTGEGRWRNCQVVGHEYYDLYRWLLSNRAAGNEHSRPRVAVVTPARTSRYQLVRAPGSTYVRLGEKLRDSLTRPVRYDWVDANSDLDWVTSQFNAVLVQRTVLENRAVEQLIQHCRHKECALIVELDDFLLNTDISWTSHREYNPRSEALMKLIRAASLLVVSTEELKKRLADLTDRIIVSPNGLSERLWFPPLEENGDGSDLDVAVARKWRDERRVIYMGSFTHADDLKLLTDAVAEVRATYPNLRFFTAGITKSPEAWYESVQIPNGNYPQFVQWFRRIARLMDFGVAPLNDTEFNRCKSTIKLLEYSGAGLPVLASDVTPYREAIMDGVTGMLVANNPSAWTAALRFACENPDRMRAMGNVQLEEIIKRHLLGQQIPKFDAAILTAIRRSGAALPRATSLGSASVVRSTSPLSSQ